MPDLDMALLILADIGRYPELNMSATKPEVEITFERKEMTTRFQWRSLTFFDLARLVHDTANAIQHLSIPDIPEYK
jgi:hypothetical protein